MSHRALGEQFDLPLRSMPMLDYDHAEMHPATLHGDFSDERYAEHEKYTRIAQSIQKHGVHTPVHVEGGVLVDGHHRVAAAYAAGHKTVPAVEVEGHDW